MLTVVCNKAMAQGGLSPYIGSSHDYTVTPESTSNTLEWTVTGGTGYVINSETTGATTSVANITWTGAGIYTLQFKETDLSTSCSTTKQVTVTVTNGFDVYTSSPAVTCNAASGVVHSGTDATTSVSFVVQMVTGSDASWEPDWEFEFNVTEGTGATVSNVASTDGTLSGGTPFKLTNITSSTGTGSATVTMDVTGSKISDLTVDLDIVSAKELEFNTADKDTDDWSATQTISGIPGTSDITTD